MQVFARYILMLFALFFVGKINANSAFVQGVFKNASPGEAVLLVAHTQYLDGAKRSAQTTLNAALEFALSIDVPFPQVAFLRFRDDFVTLFLAPGDTATIRSDAFQFPLLTHFGGPAGPNNRLWQEYLRQHPRDYNEFNDVRYKIGQWWFQVEDRENTLMENLWPDSYRAQRDERRIAALAQLDEFIEKNPGLLTQPFVDWLSAEILYDWAYHLLYYGQVYAGRYAIKPDFFSFLDEIPLQSDQIGSEWYRRFLSVFLARQAAKNTPPESFFAHQYRLAGDFLSGRALAYLRSELILMGFGIERYQEIVPCYNDFTQRNPHPEFEPKVASIYARVAKKTPGSAAPLFETTDDRETLFSMTQMRGHAVYLNFWASWCGPCIAKMRRFEPYAAELQTRGIELVHISIDRSESQWRSALEEQRFAGRHLLNRPLSALGGRTPAELFDVEAIPQYFLIDKRGLFSEKPFSGAPEEIRAKLLELSRQ